MNTHHVIGGLIGSILALAVLPPLTIREIVSRALCGVCSAVAFTSLVASWIEDSNQHGLAVSAAVASVSYWVVGPLLRIVERRSKEIESHPHELVKFARTWLIERLQGTTFRKETEVGDTTDVDKEIARKTPSTPQAAVSIGDSCDSSNLSKPRVDSSTDLTWIR